MWLPIGKIIVTIIFLLTTNAGGAGNPADEISGYPPNKASNVNYYKDKFDNLKKELDKMKSMPISISSEKVRLLKLIEDNKKEHEIIAKKLQEEETKANETNKELKLEEVKLNELREEKIRIEGVIGTIEEAIKQLTDQVKEQPITETIEPLVNESQDQKNNLLLNEFTQTLIFEEADFKSLLKQLSSCTSFVFDL